MPDILRYRGDVTNADRGHLLGPDVGRRYLTVRTVDYDPDTDISTATLHGVMPAEFSERIGPIVENQMQRERIRKLFSA